MAELEEIMTEEVVEKVVDSLLKVKFSFAALGAAIGATTGALIAFKVAYKKAEKKYEELAEHEIADIREHYTAKFESMSKPQPKPDLAVVVNKLGYSQEEQYAIDDVVAQEEVESEKEEEDSTNSNPVRNIFQDAEPTVWDYAAEVRSRNPNVPYVIHLDEFTENEKNYTQVTLTYYEDDDVLADHRDNVIEDQDMVVGLENLGKFGHGSSDPTVVYVRNDLLSQDMEITRSDGSFAEEVHGFKHSDESRRSRLDWDG